MSGYLLKGIFRDPVVLDEMVMDEMAMEEMAIDLCEGKGRPGFPHGQNKNKYKNRLIGPI